MRVVLSSRRIGITTPNAASFTYLPALPTVRQEPSPGSKKPLLTVFAPSIMPVRIVMVFAASWQSVIEKKINSSSVVFAAGDTKPAGIARHTNRVGLPVKAVG